MFTLRSSFVSYLEEIKNNKDITIIDYGVSCFKTYKDVLSVVNEIYLQLLRKGINQELSQVILNILEKLNNLKHFEVSLDNISNEDEFIQMYLNKFETFNYQKFSEFDKSNSIRILKAKPIEAEEMAKFEEIRFYNDRVDYLEKNYSDGYFVFFDKDGVIKLISCSKGVISIMEKNDPDTILSELIKLFQEISMIPRNKITLKKFYNFEITDRGIHNEIIYLINRLMMGLNYLFNSASFNDNELYSFDELELNMRVNFDLDNQLERINELIKYQLSYHL